MPTVYVDWIQICIPNKKWKYKKVVHLLCFPQDLKELRSFARKLGLKRDWEQQSKDGIIHYDMVAWWRDKAIKQGATPIDKETFLKLYQAWRSHGTS